jgi:hypothetical protein
MSKMLMPFTNLLLPTRHWQVIPLNASHNIDSVLSFFKGGKNENSEEASDESNQEGAPAAGVSLSQSLIRSLLLIILLPISLHLKRLRKRQKESN